MLLLALLIAAAPPPLPPLVGPERPAPEPAPAPREAPVMAPLVAPTPFFNALAKGTVGVSFGLPGDVPQATVGATYFIANNLALRADFGLNAIFTSGGTTTFSVNLALRMYQGRVGALAIYVAPDFNFARVAGTQSTTIDGQIVSVQTGGVEALSFGGDAGVEYFFTDHISVGGQLGLALNIGNLGGDSTVVGLSTATTGLFASAYF